MLIGTNGNLRNVDEDDFLVIINNKNFKPVKRAKCLV